MFGIYRTIVRKITTNSCSSSYPHICIVGSGPAGFYTSQKILKSHPDAQVDIYEKLPVPFGLVRYGVAPDHPEVKNCINAFTEVAKQNRVSFFGNIAVGKDVTLDQLKESYHAVVLAYGAAKDRTLNIPGENLPNVLPARRLVGWYNGLPEDSNLDVDLNVEDVVVIGQGNVAIDVARILLTPIDILRKTDIPEPVLEKLSSSRVKRVTMVGRRKAQNVAFTTKELREMINLEGSKPVIRTQDVEALSSVIESAARPRKRLLQLLQQAAMSPSPAMVDKWRGAEREWRLRFLMSPLEILAKEDGKAVTGVKFGINRIEDDAAVLTDGTEMEPCGLVLRSIGYTSVKIDPSIPFDDRKGVIPNEKGRVTGHKGLYVSGWVGTGPVGVILSTMQSGAEVGSAIVSDLASGIIDAKVEKEGKKKVIQILAQKKVRPVSFNDWSGLDRHEIEEGQRLGKPREKVTREEEMIEIAHRDNL